MCSPGGRKESETTERLSLSGKSILNSFFWRAVSRYLLNFKQGLGAYGSVTGMSAFHEDILSVVHCSSVISGRAYVCNSRDMIKRTVSRPCRGLRGRARRKAACGTLGELGETQCTGQ